jgi:predicted CXXCH cytochrome family protein
MLSLSAAATVINRPRAAERQRIGHEALAGPAAPRNSSSGVPVLELSVLIAALGASLLALHRLGLGSRGTLGLLGVTAGALALGVGLGPQPAPAASRAGIGTSGGAYVTSGACRSCHPGEYQSWHQSFHRSMTEPASPASIRAPWSGPLEWRGRRYELERRGDEFWASLPDPEQTSAALRAGRPLESIPDVERRVLMTTGSHHYQAYWVPGERGNELFQFPFVYHFESQRFIARHDVFLQPEDDPIHVARWNSNCIQCHSVAGEPRHDLTTDRFDSRAAELGIACEACHGPGAEHVRRRQNPWFRLRGPQAGDAPDIVNPARLDARRGSEVCGQCHAYFLPNDPERWWEQGFTGSYRPGGELHASRRLLHFERGGPDHDPALGASLSSLFYSDGTVRVGGREWNGSSRSACFTRGSGERQLACTSCHDLHGGSRDDQLRAGDPDMPCRGCHQDLTSTHSHHAPESSGASCVSCHMPKTTYALFKSIRSHRITVPAPDPDPGAPLNACNLCHQDRSLDWTRDWLERWYGNDAATVGVAPAPDEPLPGRAPEPGAAWSALAVAALSGDAAARVIAVAALQEEPARRVSGSSWQTQLLAEALGDPYAAVRFVAARSLRSFPGFGDLELTFDAPPAERQHQQQEARRRAARAAAGAPPWVLPLDAAGRLDREALDAFIARRDSTPVRISE